MEQYIPKSALVAEIERLKTIYSDDENIHNVAKYNILVEILSFINTLEAEDVDISTFSTEVYKYIGEHFKVYDDGNQTLQNKDKNTLIGRVDAENIAKHFFELGMQVSNKAQKGE